MTRASIKSMLADFQRRGGKITDASGKIARLVSARRLELSAPEPSIPVVVDHWNYVSECRLTFPIKLPSANKLFRKTKRAQMEFEAAVHDVVRDSWGRQGKPRIKGAFTLAWVFVCSSASEDPTNIHITALKVVVDAIKNVGCIENDSWRYHKPDHAAPHWMLNPVMDCVQVEIKAAEIF